MDMLFLLLNSLSTMYMKLTKEINGMIFKKSESSVVPKCETKLWHKQFDCKIS